ncbi:sugar ABC transporter substrate-binding protein [Dactylosporangium sp. AC04546]|uniref:ABC transporter substrate-binding protein n=1 Tax=Dactylosporangium sp. AC04546 TaxID=2862460 RepID=UPI001EDD290F|nr:sugar ABC transporter substrate-binding protein [Dactylosporangium sp. AC04546]WVK88693.1 sugar ABC transporter substrate-binding protein [Dactylosporangium sp. AC04546]
MRHRRLLPAVAAAVAALVASPLLAGCGSSSGDGTVTLTFANADPSATWQKAIDGFQKANPTVKVKQLNIPYAQYTSTINQRMSQGGGGIDLMVVDAGGALADFANRGFLADISDLKNDALNVALSPDMVTSREVGGKLYALETWTTAQFLYYNKDALAKAGVEEPPGDPAKPWTYQQLTDAARKVQTAKAADYPLLFDQWDSYYQLQMMGVSAGGGDGISADGKVDFSNAGWQKMLTWYGGLFKDGLSPRGITNDKNGALFSGGKAGFIISGPWGLPVSLSGGVKFGIAPAPYWAGGKPATSTDSWAVGISAKTKQRAAAEQFLRYLTIDPQGNSESAEVAGITPTNKESYAKYAEAAEKSAGEVSANFGDIMEYELKNSAVHRPAVTGYSVFEPGANQMFADIRNGSDPQQRAAEADRAIADQIARLK